MVLDGKGWMAVDNFGATETDTRLETVPVAHSDNALVVLDSDSGNRETETFPWLCICGRVEQSSRQDNLWDDSL